MSTGAKFATGKFAWGVCDVCGMSFKLRELRGTTVRGNPTGILSCPDCWDLDHPQNFLPYAITTDPEALRVARPESYVQSRRLPCVIPIYGLAAQTFVGQAEVATT
jgi:hypothetical protein